jgi:hypothetical protein
MKQYNIRLLTKLKFLVAVLLFFISTIISAQKPVCVCAACDCKAYISRGYDCSNKNITACLPDLCNATLEKCRIACGCAQLNAGGGTSTDINGPFMRNPGDVSIDGIGQGVPFFTSHQSSAFEDWSREYKAQLESYGIKSILGKNITPNAKPVKPLTDDPNWDEKYRKLLEDFLKDTPPVKPIKSTPKQPETISGTPKLLTDADEREKAYSKVPLYNDYLNKLPQDKAINENFNAADITVFDKMIDKMASYFPGSPAIQVGVLIAKGIEQAAFSLIDDTGKNLEMLPQLFLIMTRTH